MRFIPVAFGTYAVRILHEGLTSATVFDWYACATFGHLAGIADYAWHVIFPPLCLHLD